MKLETITVELLKYNPLGKGHDYDALYKGKIIKVDPFVGCAVNEDATNLKGMYECLGHWYSGAVYGTRVFLPSAINKL